MSWLYRLPALVLIATAMLGLAGQVYAACTGPDGEAGEVRYATNYGVMAFCNGTEWVSMAGGVDVSVGGSTGATTLDELTDATISSPATGQYLTYSAGGQWVNTASPLGTITDTKWCVGNASGQVVCNTDAPITVESDPQVGTLTNTKWCTTDGTAINCATDAPITAEVDPEVGTLTANLFCQVNAGGTALVCANDAATQRTALGLGTMAEQNANAVAITGGSATGLTGLTAVNVTATTALSAARICDETGSNCVSPASLNTSAAQADRIVSGTTSVIAYAARGVSVSAALEVSGAVKVATTLQVQGDDGGSCGAGRYYTLRVNASTGQLEVCRP